MDFTLPLRRGSSFSLILSACFILAVYAGDSGTCALDRAGNTGCDDNSAFIQSRVLVSESRSVIAPSRALMVKEEETKEEAPEGRKKTITVKCKFMMVEQDDNEKTGEALEYGMCEDEKEEVYYIRDDSGSEDLDPGSIISVELEEIKNPKLPGADQGPWKAEGKPLYRVIEEGASLLSSAEEVAATNRAKYGLTQEGVKEIGFLMVLLNYTDQDLVFTDIPRKILMTEALIWKGTYAKPEDWLTDPDLKQLTHGKHGWRSKTARLRGSWGDVLEKSSGGKLSVPEKKGRVVTVQMGKAWADEICSFTKIGKQGLRKAKEQFPDLDPGAYDFREIFTPMRGSESAKQ